MLCVDVAFLSGLTLLSLAAVTTILAGDGDGEPALAVAICTASLAFVAVATILVLGVKLAKQHMLPVDVYYLAVVFILVCLAATSIARSSLAASESTLSAPAAPPPAPFMPQHAHRSSHAIHRANHTQARGAKPVPQAPSKAAQPSKAAPSKGTRTAANHTSHVLSGGKISSPQPNSKRDGRSATRRT